MTSPAAPATEFETVPGNRAASGCTMQPVRRVLTRTMLAAFALALACAAFVLPAAAQQRANRVALIIGNANYPDANTPLGTTVRDARTLADEFKRLDFEVDVQENAGKEEMKRAIDAFNAKIRNGTEALFYFSGFGSRNRTARISRAGQRADLVGERRDARRRQHRRSSRRHAPQGVRRSKSSSSMRHAAIPYRAPLPRFAAQSCAARCAGRYARAVLGRAGAVTGTTAKHQPEHRHPRHRADQGTAVSQLGRRAEPSTARASASRARRAMKSMPWIASSLLEEVLLPRLGEYAGACTHAGSTCSRSAGLVAQPAPAPAPAPRPAPAPAPVLAHTGPRRAPPPVAQPARAGAASGHIDDARASTPAAGVPRLFGLPRNGRRARRLVPDGRPPGIREARTPCADRQAFRHQPIEIVCRMAAVRHQSHAITARAIVAGAATIAR